MQLGHIARLLKVLIDVVDFLLEAGQILVCLLQNLLQLLALGVVYALTGQQVLHLILKRRSHAHIVVYATLHAELLLTRQHGQLT